MRTSVLPPAALSLRDELLSTIEKLRHKKNRLILEAAPEFQKQFSNELISELVSSF